MKKILILISLIFFSCNSNNEPKSESEVTYRMLIKENDKYNSYLIENIENKIKEKEKNHGGDKDILVVRSATGRARQGGKYICTKTSKQEAN